MAHVKGGVTSSRRHKKFIRLASGYRSSRSRCYKTAKSAVDRAMVNAYSGRKMRKRFFRRLWIQRISAFSQSRGLSYSQLIHAMKDKGITVNRKVLSEIAYSDASGASTILRNIQK